MKTPLIDTESFAYALTLGHIMDIGQVTPEMKRILERAVRKGQVGKCFAFFPGLIAGISSRKTTYVRKTSDSIHPLVDHRFVT